MILYLATITEQVLPSIRKSLSELEDLLNSWYHSDISPQLLMELEWQRHEMLKALLSLQLATFSRG